MVCSLSSQTTGGGGMGILNLREMDISLLFKWQWKLKNPHYSSTWKDLIITKYCSGLSLHKSSFWLAISRLETLGNTSIGFEPGSINSTVKFWKNIWYQHCSLATRFDHIYQFCTNKEVLLVDVIASQGSVVQFRRILVGTDQADWVQILSIVNSTQLPDSLDTLLWR